MLKVLTATAAVSGRHSVSTVRATILAGMESNAPDQILKALAHLDGKNITSRFDKLVPGFIILRRYGWTEFASEEYRRSGGNRGMRLLLAHTESSVPLSLAFVEKENPSYFAGRRERNAERIALLNDEARMQEIADALNAQEAAEAAVKLAEKRVEDAIPSSVRYAFRKESR